VGNTEIGRPPSLSPCVPNDQLEKSLTQVHMKCLVRNSIDHSLHSEANSRSAGQKMSLLLYNPNVHYHVNKSPTLVIIVSQMNPVHTHTSYARSKVVHRCNILLRRINNHLQRLNTTQKTIIHNFYNMQHEVYFRNI
jgi:hypothetical protein